MQFLHLVARLSEKIWLVAGPWKQGFSAEELWRLILNIWRLNFFSCQTSSAAKLFQASNFLALIKRAHPWSKLHHLSPKS
jgi:hypothetical protein